MARCLYDTVDPQRSSEHFSVTPAASSHKNTVKLLKRRNEGGRNRNVSSCRFLARGLMSCKQLFGRFVGVHRREADLETSSSILFLILGALEAPRGREASTLSDLTSIRSCELGL